MFLIHLASSVRIGDTIDCRINAQPAQVTYRNAETLVIEPHDARRIVQVIENGDLNCFICADADGYSDFTVNIPSPKRGGRHV